jgi:subtilase family serine protease
MKFKKIILVICLSTVTTLLISSSEIYADKNPINTVYKSLTNGKLIKPAHLSQNTTTSFDIILKPKISPLKTASEVNTPGSANFKQFITPGTLAKTYGQSTAIINRWTRFLKKKHLKVTNFNNIVLNVNGKAKNIDNTFKVDINTAKYHHDPLQFGKRRPRFNKTLQNSVWFLSGLTDHNPNYRLPADSGFASSSSNSHPGFTKRFTDRYNVTPLYRKGLTGSGQTIGIIAFGNLRKTNAFHFWRHEKASTDPERLSIKRVTGPQTHPRLVSNDELETTMDTEYAGSVAPNANIKVYLVSDALPSITNMINAYLTAFHQNTASSLSNSWGLSYGSNYAQLLKQHLVSPHFKQLLDLVLSQGALQGISSFTEAGDYGALNLASTKSSYRKRTLLDINTSSADVLSANP